MTLSNAFQQNLCRKFWIMILPTGKRKQTRSSTFCCLYLNAIYHHGFQQFCPFLSSVEKYIALICKSIQSIIGFRDLSTRHSDVYNDEKLFSKYKVPSQYNWSSLFTDSSLLLNSDDFKVIIIELFSVPFSIDLIL